MDNTNLPAPPDTRKMSDDAQITPVLGLGRLAPFAWERSADKTVIRLFWGRILLWLIALTSIGWVSLASGAYTFVKYRRGFTDVRYTHMLLLPWKLDDYRKSKGEFLIKQGMDLAEKQEWRAAFSLLRTGLVTVPEHREARLMVARLYLMAGRPDMVRTILIEGLPHHGDQLDYLRQVLGFFFGLQADDTVVSLTGDLRTRLAPENPAHRMATTAQAYAHFNRGRYAEAEELLRSSRLLGTPEGRFVMARIAWEKNQREQAMAQLGELTARVPEDPEIYRTLVFYLRENRRWPELRRTTVARQLALPDRAEAYVDFIAACSDQGDETARTQAEESYFERFANNPEALLKLSEDAARSGRVDTTRRVATRCRELGRKEPDATSLLFTALLERKAYREIGSLWAQLQPSIPAWPERQQLIVGGLRGIALYGQGDEVEAQPFVRRLYETRSLPAQTLTVLAGQLDKVGQKAEAHRVLRHAVEIDPLYQPATTLLLRKLLAENQLEEAPALIDRLLTMRKPPADLLAELAQVLSSDLYLFQPGKERAQAKIKAYQDRTAPLAGP